MDLSSSRACVEAPALTLTSCGTRQVIRSSLGYPNGKMMIIKMMTIMMMNEHCRAVVGVKLYYVYKWRCALGAFKNWQLLGTLFCPVTLVIWAILPVECSVCLSLNHRPCSRGEPPQLPYLSFLLALAPGLRRSQEQRWSF